MFNCVNIEDINRELPSASTAHALRKLLVNYYATDITCYQSYHFIHVVFGGLMIIIFTFLCFAIKITMIDSIISNSSLNVTYSGQFDMKLLIMKMILSIIFCFFGANSNTWILSVVLVIISFGLLYSYYKDQPYSNERIKLFYSFCLSLFCWGSTVLFIGKLFEKSHFDGSIPLFLIGIPIILLILFSEYQEPMTILLKNINSLTNSTDALKQISLCLQLINQKDINRLAKIIIKGYSFQYEATCGIEKSPLYKYLQSGEKGTDVPAFFLQHIELLYQNALAKFPTCFSLHISYCKFILRYLNKKQQVNQILIALKDDFHSFSQEFTLYHFKKLIEEHYLNFNEDDDSSSIVSSLAHSKLLIEFKQTINKVSILYLDFWNLILNNHQSPDQLTTLNDYGTKINKSIEELNEIFQKIQKMKTNNQEVLYYYSVFLKDILNDREKALLYSDQYHDAEDNKQIIDDTHYFNYDLNALSSSDEYQYIIISGSPLTMGLITNISLGVCLLLGYSRDELIGKANEIIMPEIYHQMHRQILLDKLSDFKKEMGDVNQHINYRPSFKEINTFARTKARYLLNITFKVALISTETQGISFIAKIAHEPQSTNINDVLNTVCYVITDNNFVMQNFTVNAVNLLGMNSNVMNHSLELTAYIKQFHEEYLKLIVDNQGITSEQKMQLKRHIINKKLRYNAPIIWKSNDLKNGKFKNNESTVNISADLTKIFKAPIQDCFLLNIQDLIIVNLQVGYVFKFEIMSPAYYHSFVKSNNSLTSMKDFNFLNKIPPNNRHTLIQTFSSNRISQMSKEFNEETSLEHYKSFLPDSKLNFVLDTQKLSYKMTYDNSIAMRENIQKQAIAKIKAAMEANKDKSEITEENSSENNPSNSNYNSESDAEDEDEDEDESLDNNNNESFKTPSCSIKHIKANELLSKALQEDYYKVTMSNIKYSIYSFEKGMIVELPSYQKKSQVDCKMFEEKEINYTLTKKIKIEKESNNPQIKDIDENIDQDTLLIKQIEYALTKDDSQPSIIKLKWISYAILLFYLILGAAWLYVILDGDLYLNEGFTIISINYALIYNTLYIHAMIRDLTLLSHENYTDSLFNTDKTQLITEALNAMNLLYFDSSNNILAIMTTFMPLSKNSSYFVRNKTIETRMIKDNLSMTTYNSTIHESFIEVNTASYHVMKELKVYLPSNNWIYFYIGNINNQMCLSLEEQSWVFIEEMMILIHQYLLYLGIVAIIGFIFIIGTYVLFALSYNEVGKQKESYLEVFFDISVNVIKASIDKCEKFIKKIQYESFNEFITSDDNEHFEDNDIIHNTAEGSNKKESRKEHDKNSNKLKETIVIKLLYLIFIIFVIVLSVSDYVFYFFFLDKVSKYILLFQNQNDINIEFIKLYRNMREYTFDEETIVNLKIIKDTFHDSSNSFYTLIDEKQKIVNKYQYAIQSKLKEMYYSLYQGNLWDLLNINTTKVNTSLYSSPSYGFHSVLSNFIEEIRAIKNEKMRYKKICPQFKYNLTLLGLKGYDDLFPEDPNDNVEYFKCSPMQIFNSKVYHRVKMVFELFIKPGFANIYNTLTIMVFEYLWTNKLFFGCMSGLYFLIIIGLFIFAWIPFEKGLKNTIFKTKNLLSIIPKEILGALTNVKKLLKIDTRTSIQKGSNNNK